jgi:hypothetical protein
MVKKGQANGQKPPFADSKGSRPQVNFSLPYWTWWVALAFLWGHAAAAVTVLLPLWEGRAAIRAALGLPPAASPADRGGGGGGGGGRFVELESFRLADAAGRFGTWIRPAAGRGRPDVTDAEATV